MFFKFYGQNCENGSKILQVFSRIPIGKACFRAKSQEYFGYGTKPSTRSSVDLCLTLRQFCASLSLHQTGFSLNTIHSSSIHALTVLNKVRPQSLKMILWLNQGGYLFCPPLACLSAAAAALDQNLH